MTEISLDKKKKLYVLKKFDSVSPLKEREQTQNIFNGEQLRFLHGQQQNLQQRQIVGKLEQFLKQREQFETVQKQQNSQYNSSNSTKMFAKRITLRNSSQKSLFISSEQNQEQKLKKQKDYQIVSQQFLLDFVKKTEDRIKMNNEIEEDLKRLNDKNNQLRQTRALTKFQQQQQIWEQQVEEATRKSKKYEYDSVIRKSTCNKSEFILVFREKVEQIEHFQALKQQEGTARASEWYMTLRDNLGQSRQLSQEEREKKRSAYQDPFNQNTYYVDSSNKPIEIIRNQQQSTSVSKSGFRRNSSLSQINIFKLPLYKTVQTIGEDLCNLQIEGQNVLQKETELIKHYNSNEKFRLYKLEKETETEV
ncbi:unnamed protein product (macronuclear) [Paramecium tetraurelia]|uniref:DUF4200 domain-containing protein n=1 Tax=Paramecium tetraurelia TaxID=5888 RepID=A0CSI6_PARTE|nr:uncharacterized protein GSPATT00010025001 [Paramecium tetraurelia]CAK73753.1 unnamed protein product [Paramecium tetraurelia]|eukprot:XP_001441150.1 hypothetical protein (macronuclear) [Paramecium tetraurelia strain d4-2]